MSNTLVSFDPLIANATVTPEQWVDSMEIANSLFEFLMRLNASDCPRFADSAGPEMLAANHAWDVHNRRTGSRPARKHPLKPGPYYHVEMAIKAILDHLTPMHTVQILQRMYETGEQPSSAALYHLEDLQREERYRRMEESMAEGDARAAGRL